MSKTIVFHVGYYKQEWSPSESPVGGTEKVIINVSREIKKNNPHYTVIVSGTVIDVIDEYGVVYISTNNINSDLEVDILYCVNYIHGIFYYPKSVNKIFYFHNTDYYPYYKGDSLVNGLEILRNSFDSYIVPSFWLRDFISERYRLDVDLVEVIPHGVEERFIYDRPRTIFDNDSYIRLVWLSSSDRGLLENIEYFKIIRQKYRNAELIVCSPKYSKDWFDYSTIKDIDGVRYIGHVDDVSALLKTCHASLYITQYVETFCLSVYEMIASGLLVITSKVAALIETNITNTFSEEDKVLETFVKNINNYTIPKDKLNTWADIYQIYWSYKIK